MKQLYELLLSAWKAEKGTTRMSSSKVATWLDLDAEAGARQLNEMWQGKTWTRPVLLHRLARKLKRTIRAGSEPAPPSGAELQAQVAALRQLLDAVSDVANARQHLLEVQAAVRRQTETLELNRKAGPAGR